MEQGPGRYVRVVPGRCAGASLGVMPYEDDAGGSGKPWVHAPVSQIIVSFGHAGRQMGLGRHA